MNDKIPRQLRNPEFRFYLVGKGQKLPMKKCWNSTNNYHFFHSRLDEHLLRKGNYGIVTGFGNLIVLDFDDREYYEEIVKSLPPTFTVLSASKRLPHMYYYLDGEMFKKKGIDRNNKRVCDIQADKCGIVAPNSSVNRKYYDVIHDIDIATITKEEIERIFGITTEKKRVFTGDVKPRPEAVEKAKKILSLLGMELATETHYACPFHEMSGKGNLTIMDTGRLYCFHEQRCWNDVFDFAIEVCKFRKNVVLEQTIRIIRSENVTKRNY